MNVSGEVTGLDQCIAYAQHLAEQAGAHGPAGNEVYLGRLVAAGITGAGLMTGSGMQQAFAQASLAATAHAGELGKQTTVQEQYDANPDAGDKAFHTGDPDTQENRMSKDLDPVSSPSAEPDTGKPFVRVFKEKGTGNVIIALDAEAMDGLLTILDAADLKEMHDNPDYLGMQPDEANLAADVGWDILGQLRKLNPYG